MSAKLAKAMSLGPIRSRRISNGSNLVDHLLKVRWTTNEILEVP